MQEAIWISCVRFISASAESNSPKKDYQHKSIVLVTARIGNTIAILKSQPGKHIRNRHVWIFLHEMNDSLEPGQKLFPVNLVLHSALAEAQ